MRTPFPLFQILINISVLSQKRKWCEVEFMLRDRASFSIQFIEMRHIWHVTFDLLAFVPRLKNNLFFLPR